MDDIGKIWGARINRLTVRFDRYGNAKHAAHLRYGVVVPPEGRAHG